jgi:cellobiose phosphorylase
MDSFTLLLLALLGVAHGERRGVSVLHKHGNQLTIDPRVPSEWDSFTLRYRYGSSTYIIHCMRQETGATDNVITLVDDGGVHEITAKM